MCFCLSSRTRFLLWLTNWPRLLPFSREAVLKQILRWFKDEAALKPLEVRVHALRCLAPTSLLSALHGCPLRCSSSLFSLLCDVRCD